MCARGEPMPGIEFIKFDSLKLEFFCGLVRMQCRCRLHTDRMRTAAGDGGSDLSRREACCRSEMRARCNDLQLQVG